MLWRRLHERDHLGEEESVDGASDQDSDADGTPADISNLSARPTSAALREAPSCPWGGRSVGSTQLGGALFRLASDGSCLVSLLLAQ